MEKIQMVDLQTQYLRIKPEIDAAIQRVLTSAAFIQGSDVKEFSNALAKYLGVKYAITCGNGTDALQIAMMALGFEPGDEVILPAHTYVATAEVIALLKLKPVFVDVDEKTFNLDVEQLGSKITNKTVAIVPVHLYGQCADMEPILNIATKHNLYIIEDAAQALGAAYTFSDGKKRMAGTMGTIGTTSFFPTKNLGCFGDGGAILTNDEHLATKIKMIASHGQTKKYHHETIGVNSRLDTLQAAVLNVKLKYLDEYTLKRSEVALFYDAMLASTAGIEVPFRAPNTTHVFHQYTVKVKGNRRDDFKKYLSDNGIPAMIYYHIPLHMQKAYLYVGCKEGDFPVTERLSKTVISLPIHTEMTTDQLEVISATIKKYF
ncbi:MAG: DegT/DnrJ/EryC1/StrS family aminotransferase [Cyclobacteriaceae bacterium]|nr:DegT/DnrJ/EryC1/StrS family aminotransferase [Cyclobacteriaceae bacterium]MDH4294656.1 DegT/DnrJ/EryC1/StrS family aminotransferase [Cyclobacteriaceae bacterium]MDH5247510.1 DegT/DnrJ/EryC1/StrS family aminotransferase [Cyclobacteriaceae bacterium]